MSKTIKCIFISIIIILLLCVIVLSIILNFKKPIQLEEIIKINNISEIIIEGVVPEKENKKFEVKLSDSEVKTLILMIKQTKVQRVLFTEDYDEAGICINIYYNDGYSIETSYGATLKIDKDRYEVLGYVFDYIYGTDSYKTAYEQANSEE